MNMLPMVVLAQAEAPWLVYLNYGVLGATVLMLILGKIVPGILYDRAEKRHERELSARDAIITKQDEEIRRLNAYFVEHVIPAIIAFTEASRHDKP